MVDVNKALVAYLQEQNEKRTKWTGDFLGIKEMYAKPRCPADEDVLAKNGATDVMTQGAKFGTYMTILVCHKAEDSAGNRIFNINRDLPLLMRVDEEVIAEIYLGLFKGQGPETEDEFEARVGN